MSRDTSTRNRRVDVVDLTGDSDQDEPLPPERNGPSISADQRIPRLPVQGDEWTVIDDDLALAMALQEAQNAADFGRDSRGSSNSMVRKPAQEIYDLTSSPPAMDLSGIGAQPGSGIRGRADSEREDADRALAMRLQEEFDRDQRRQMLMEQQRIRNRHQILSRFPLGIHQGILHANRGLGIFGLPNYANSSDYDEDDEDGSDFGSLPPEFLLSHLYTPRVHTEQPLNYEEMIALSERIGTVTRGATDMEISRLPEQVFASPSSSSSSADQEKLTCAICMGEFQVNDVLLLMPGCLHRFHKPCIETWLKQSRKCPVCRVDVFDCLNEKLH